MSSREERVWALISIVVKSLAYVAFKGFARLACSGKAHIVFIAD